MDSSTNLEQSECTIDIQPNDLIADNDMKFLISASIEIPRLLKQGLGVREISALLNVPYTLVNNVAAEIGHKSVAQSASINDSKAKKQRRKAQRRARKVSRKK